MPYVRSNETYTTIAIKKEVHSKLRSLAKKDRVMMKDLIESLIEHKLTWEERNVLDKAALLRQVELQASKDAEEIEEWEQLKKVRKHLNKLK